MLEIKSHIDMSEVVENTFRKSRNEVDSFYPVFVIDDERSKSSCALFTEHEIEKALKRGSKNVEDVDNIDFDDLVIRLHIGQDESIRQEYEIARFKRELKERDAEIENLAYELEYAMRPWWKKLFSVD